MCGIMILHESRFSETRAPIKYANTPFPCMIPEVPMQITTKQLAAAVLILLLFLFFVGAALIDTPRAEQQTSGEDPVCPWCGRVHGDSPADRFLQGFHWILDFPTRLFERLLPPPGRILPPRPGKTTTPRLLQ